jgi:RNA polymerase sigma-70 factor, ECF subfamily
MSQVGEAGVLTAARAGDESAFSALVERYRRELQVHCYRMLGSLEDAEDAVQETLLRAWRRRETFRGDSSFRAWLYGIATNVCLDAIGRRPKATPREGVRPLADVPWLQPYPDRLLEGPAPSDEEPEAELVAKETIELAFIATIQLLPPRQRAVLISRDVLGWSAAECAALLDTSVAAVNSALQRARETLKRHLPRRRVDWAPGDDPSEEERRLLERYMEAAEAGDSDAMVQLLREDAFQAMPPDDRWWVGSHEIVESWVEGGFGDDAWGRLRCVPTSANGQPAVACYVKRAGDTEYRPLAVDVLRLEDGAVAEIIVFSLDEQLLDSLGLPPTL